MAGVEGQPQLGPAEFVRPEGGERGPVSFLGQGHRLPGSGLARHEARQGAPRGLG